MPGSRSYTVIIGDTWRSHHSDSKPCKCIPLYAQLNAPSTHLIRMERDSRECTAWAPPGTLEGTKGSEGPWSLIFFLVNLRSLESVFSTLGICLGRVTPRLPSSFPPCISLFLKYLLHASHIPDPVLGEMRRTWWCLQHRYKVMGNQSC